MEVGGELLEVPLTSVPRLEKTFEYYLLKEIFDERIIFTKPHLNRFPLRTLKVKETD